MRLLLVLLSALLASAATNALGSEPMCDPNDAKSCATPLLAGSAAPYSGILLTPRRSAKVTVGTEQCSERIDLAKAEEAAVAAIALLASKALRESDLVAHGEHIKIMRSGMEAYKEQFAPHWYDHHLLWFTVGVVTTVGVTAGAVAIVEARAKLATP